MTDFLSVVWKVIVAAFMLVVIGAALLLTVRPMPEPEPNVHKIMSVPTDHEDVVCFFRLNAANEPRDMSCVHKGEQEWPTQRPTTTAQW